MRLGQADAQGHALPAYVEEEDAGIDSGWDIDDSARDAELDTLSALMYRPTQLDDIGEWLTPEDFGSPDCAATYAAMLDLHNNGTPVDVVTVAWQQQRYAGARGEGLSIAELQEVARWGSVTADVPARQVIDASGRRHSNPSDKPSPNPHATPAETPEHCYARSTNDSNDWHASTAPGKYTHDNPTTNTACAETADDHGREVWCGEWRLPLDWHGCHVGRGR